MLSASPQLIYPKNRFALVIEKTRDFSFILFLLAGAFKADPRLQFLNFDLTIAFALLSFVLTLFTMGSHGTLRELKWSVGYAFLFFLFAFFALFSLVYANSSIDYSQDKALRFLFLGGWAVVGSLFIQTERRLLWFTQVYGFCAIIFALSGIANYFTSSSPAISQVSASAFSSSYLVLGRVCSSALPVFLINSVLSYGFWRKSYSFMGTILLITATILSASRGPILSLLLVTILTPFALGQRVRRWLGTWLVFTFAVAVLVIFATFYSPTIFNKTLARFAVLQDNVRISLYDDALRIWEAHPVIGVGLGNYSVYFPDRLAGDMYPHNMILESLAELGLIGGLLAVLLLGIPLFLFYQQRAWRKPIATILFMMFLATVLNAMFSGDYNDNRVVFVLAVLAITSAQLPSLDDTVSPTEQRNQ